MVSYFDKGRFPLCQESTFLLDLRRNNRFYDGYHLVTDYTDKNLIEVKAGCIQLPIDSLDSLLIHEITHDYVLDHGSIFYHKMEELGSKHLCDLDHRLFEEGKWPYIRF